MKHPWFDETDEKIIGTVDINGLLTFVKRHSYIVAGTTCNCGLKYKHRMKIDPIFSLNENFQYMVEKIQENEMNGKKYIIIKPF